MFYRRRTRCRRLAAYHRAPVGMLWYRQTNKGAVSVSTDGQEFAVTVYDQMGRVQGAREVTESSVIAMKRADAYVMAMNGRNGGYTNES